MAAARADAGVGGLGALLPRSSFLGPKGLGATARVPSPQRRRENAFRQNVPGAGAGAGAGAPSPSPLLPGRQRGVVAPRAIASSSLPAYRKRTHGRSGIGVTEVQEPPRPSSPESALPPLLPRPVVPSPYEKEAPLVKEARKLETVLEFSLAPDDASLAEQLLLVKSIQRSTGLCRSAVGEPVACPQDPTGVHPKQPCFQLVPRTIRAPASSLSPESYSLLTDAQVIKAGAETVEAEWPLELARLTFPAMPKDAVEGGQQDGAPLVGPVGGMSLSSAPATPDDLDWLLETSGATALILLEPEGSLELLGVNTKGILARAAVRSVPTFRIAMGEHDEENQAEVLPEAVRVLASLLSTGHRVHISCLRGLTCGPLVVLGYLTFYKGMEFTAAVEAIKQSCPGASPSYASWEQAKERMLAGANTQRMTELAQAAYHRRVAGGGRGSPADDWKMAQRRLLTEALTQRVSGDVSMSHSLAQAQLMQAEEVVAEQLKEAEARAAQRTRLLARQVEELQRSRTEAAGAAASAAEQIQFFRSQVEELTAREAEAREALAEAADRVEALLQQLDELRRRERDARAGVAFSVERKEALQEELDRMRQKNDSLAEALQAGKADVAVAEERARQLSVQLERVKALEEAAREMASTMQLKAETLATTVVELEKRAAESQEHAQSLDTQLQIALRKDEESQRVVAVLQERVSKLGKEASEAQGALRAANSRVQFFFRVMNRLMEREKDAQRAAQDAVDRLRAALSQAEGVRRADVVMAQAWHLAREKTQVLCMQLDTVEILSAEALVLADKNGLLTSPHPEAEAARRMLEEAKERKQQLNEQVKDLEKQLQEAARVPLKTDQSKLRGKEGEGEEGDGAESGKEEHRKAAIAALEILQQQEEVEEKVMRQVEAQAQQNGQLAHELNGAQSDLQASRKEAEQLRAQVRAAREAAAVADELRRKVAVAEAEAKRARDAEAAAKDRSEFLLRQLERMREKLEGEKAAQRVDAGAREASLQREIQGLRDRERVAKEAAVAAERKAEELSVQMGELEKREAAAKGALAEAQARIDYFFRRSREQEQKERRSRAAIAETRKQVMDLGHQMSSLKASLARSGSDTKSSLGHIDDLKKMSLDLMHKLRHVEEGRD